MIQLVKIAIAIVAPVALLQVVTAADVDMNTGTVVSKETAIHISSRSQLGQRLLQHAQPVEDGGTEVTQPRWLNEDNNNENVDYSYIAEYSIKFQGCHHVQQWNDNVDESSDVRIMTKRLARFRLCPTDQCSNDKSSGCTSKYGDYIVDMDTFVEAYLTAMEDEKEDICADADTECSAKCTNADDDCMTSCYSSIDLAYCASSYNGDAENGGFDPKEYAFCKEINLQEYANANARQRRLDDAAQDYFIGAFCADQGGDIHLGLFTDDTCTSFASNGYSLFQTATGFSMPYSESSLVTARCLSCGSSENGVYTSKEVCESPYKMAGKCETKMSIDYTNESSCNYIEGIKIIQQDGVIRTSAVRKSKAAAVGIGAFTTLSVLLAAYVYYLRTKLMRAQINLAAAAQPFA